MSAGMDSDRGTGAKARPPSRWFEDFPVGLVVPFGPHTVDRDEVLAFAARFDPQPFHLDEAAAAATPFGRIAASGWHTASITMRLMCDAYLLDAASLGSPGVERMQWPHPVYPGDVLSGRCTVQSARRSRSRPGLGLTDILTETFNAEGRLVFSMQGVQMLRCREA